MYVSVHAMFVMVQNGPFQGVLSQVGLLGTFSLLMWEKCVIILKCSYPIHVRKVEECHVDGEIHECWIWELAVGSYAIQ